MQNWSIPERVLAVVAGVVAVAVVALGVVALRSSGQDADPECEVATLDSELTSDTGAVDALRRFVQARPDDFPVDDSWIVQSDEGGVTVFSSRRGGQFEVEVADGLVRRYAICPES